MPTLPVGFAGMIVFLSRNRFLKSVSEILFLVICIGIVKHFFATDRSSARIPRVAFAPIRDRFKQLMTIGYGKRFPAW